MDLETRTRLGLCTAVHVKDVLVLLFEDGMGQHSLTKSTIEAEMLSSSYCSRSQQKFLDPKSTDNTIKPSVRGVGGNQTTQRCIIIQQSKLGEDQISLICQGIMHVSTANNTWKHPFPCIIVNAIVHGLVSYTIECSS